MTIKQNITLDQLNELSGKKMEEYFAYSKKEGWRKPGCDYDLWNIGQMIEYLGEVNCSYEYPKHGLCEELWDKVKQRL